MIKKLYKVVYQIKDNGITHQEKSIELNAPTEAGLKMFIYNHKKAMDLSDDYQIIVKSTNHIGWGTPEN